MARCIIVAFIGGGVAVLKLFGVDLNLVDIDVEATITALFTVVGTILAIVGRLKAKSTIAPTS